MTQDLLTGNAAAAWGARLADVDYVPAYPITPQTEIIETLVRWIAEDAVHARLVTMDSEHSMLTAAAPPPRPASASSPPPRARGSSTASRCSTRSRAGASRSCW